MKKKVAVLFALLLLGFGLSSCAKATAPKAGSAKATDMLSLLPSESKGVVVIDFHRIMQTDAAAKAIAESENKAKYDEFIQTAGIDPQKDIFYFVGAVLGDFGQKEMDGVGLVNLRYEKEKLLALLQKERGEMTTEEYNGFTVYKAAASEDKKPVSGVFLDESNILFGTDSAVKKVIDVHQKKAESLAQVPDMAAFMSRVDMSGIAWSAVSYSPEQAKMIADSNPLLKAIEGFKGVITAIDDRDSTLVVDLRTL
ncbi:MAG TPA: hypothetical protein DIW61_07070, partial [Candidatus Aminicenantes bacterium]|nr:hypothetical protein [Candidatus Aminicenantes bacterium]